MGNDLKFCKHCREKIPANAVICTKCGRQVEEIENKMPQIINNVASSASSSASSAASANVAERPIRYVKKWVAFFLCLFLGFLGAHKFYEGKIGTGLLYLFTLGAFLIGWIVDIFNILGKTDPYPV